MSDFDNFSKIFKTNPQKVLTFPKLPFPNTFRKLKSSTVYFRNLGMVVAGAVTLHGDLGIRSPSSATEKRGLLARQGAGDPGSLSVAPKNLFPILVFSFFVSDSKRC